MADYYSYQKFFNLQETDSINLKDKHFKLDRVLPLQDFSYERNLFDRSESKLTRTIKASWLDLHIDTKEDFFELVNKMQDVKTVVIINDRVKCKNPIYRNYSIEMLKSYIKAFRDKGFECYCI